MSAAQAEVVARLGEPRPDLPLVVLLHGRGSDERAILPLASALPARADHVALRGPLPLDTGGYAWFANRGIGRPVTASLRTELDRFATWLDAEAPPERPVVLVGFSGGGLFASAAALDRPARVRGLAALHCNLPFDAGLDLSPGALAGLPVLVTQGEQDRMIDPGLSARSWDWLSESSGAALTAYRDPGGHELSPGTVRLLATWLADLLDG